MTPLKLSKDGSHHVTDEVINTCISGVGAVLSAVGSFFLLKKAFLTGDAVVVASFSIYAVALVSLFTVSALHHGYNGTEETNRFLRQLDYFAIYILIAASFTPLCLILLKGSAGWLLLAGIWLLAAIGVGIKAARPDLPKKYSIFYYAAMSLLGVFISGPLYELSPAAAFMLILSGVVLFIGLFIYFHEKPNPIPGKFGFHEIWHLHVLLGVGLQFGVILLFLL
ncbi:MAG: hemolysin III family protein [Deltaproteobacteria bacterium]|nr:hemolysin III family protein [Deltaproteobacteria bacterium]